MKVKVTSKLQNVSFSMPQEFGSLPHTVRTIYILLSCVLSSKHSGVTESVNANHLQARNVWCRLRQRWTVAQWSNVTFSGELKFVLDFRDWWQRVLRQTAEHYQPPALVAHDRYGGRSVMVWGGITLTGRTELHTCHRGMSLDSATVTMPLNLMLFPTTIIPLSLTLC